MRILVVFFTLISIALTAQEKPIVVVELFTSEGCSSCPPADRLLSKIVNDVNEDVEVVGLSFHVDYWDYIGWKDPYASGDYTIRQRAYARRFLNNTIYTPQMVVNGRHEFVGSSNSNWSRAYNKEKQKQLTELEVSSLKINNGRLTVSITSSDAEKSVLNVAIVERDLTQNVTRGENRGRTLSHDNVVRSFDSRQFNGEENTFSLAVPADLDLSKASLVAYAQNEKSWYVNAATKVDLSEFQ